MISKLNNNHTITFLSYPSFFFIWGEHLSILYYIIFVYIIKSLVGDNTQLKDKVGRYVISLDLLGI